MCSMNKLLLFVLLICSVGFLHISRADISPEIRGYVFTVPKRLLSGETASGCLSLHNVQLPANVSLELLNLETELTDKVLANVSGVMTTGTETCLQLHVPLTTYKTGRIRLTIKFEKHPEYVIKSVEPVEIERDSLLTFVETDKTIYKPGQTVNIRILMLKHDLKPWTEVIPKVWIETPSEIRVKQWTNVSTENGMVQLRFPLSPEPSSGTWAIKMQKLRSEPSLTHTTKFDVEKYVLPRFQVMIKAPEYILPDAVNVTWNICVKYSYGKPVKGTLLLKLTPRTPTWKRTPNLPAISSEKELDGLDACTDFVLSAQVLELAHWTANPNNIVLQAQFTENGTGIVGTAFSRTEMASTTLKLELNNYSPKYFKPSLPYHGKLRVLNYDNTPVANENIQVCLKVRGKTLWYADTIECRYFESSADGFIDFIVPPQPEKVFLFSFIATAVNYPARFFGPEKLWQVHVAQPTGKMNVYPWYSPSNSYITVARGNQPIVCGEKYSFNVIYTAPFSTNESISFYYSINSKGSILTYGIMNHKPSSDSMLNYTEFHNLLGNPKASANRSVYNDPVVYRFPLSVKVTPSMAPVSELLLYYVQLDGEIVATTFTIEVGHCFENKVRTAWHTETETPGAQTQYHIEAAPWSLCGISAVDKSTLFLSKSKSNMINATHAFDQLRKFHPVVETPSQSSHCSSAATKELEEEFDHLPLSPQWRRRKRENDNSAIYYVDARQAFTDFGVIVMSDLTLFTRPCPLTIRRSYGFAAAKVYTLRKEFEFAVAAAAMLPRMEETDEVSQQIETLRSYFPETWLWDLVPIGKEGKVTIERTLPHTITDWVGYTTCISPNHGLGIAPPTTITAFQSFFLDYSLPYSVKRGEMVHLKVSLFNYMQDSLPVKIELQEMAGVSLQFSRPNASFCVQARENIVHEYILLPRVIGETNITVSASIDTEFPELCGSMTTTFLRDVIVKPMLVLPEGFPMEMTKSALICPADFKDDTTSIWDLELPQDIVPDSQRAYLNLMGGVIGPAMENLDNLVTMPKGCAEQNMVLFAPSIYVIKYLDSVGINNPLLRRLAIKYVEEGYQRELRFMRSHGSYSVFGTDIGSIWLTSFVLKSFSQARNLIYIDEANLRLTANWLMHQQLETGCFPMIGISFHKQMMGGIQNFGGSSAPLTAYVLISLLEYGEPLPSTFLEHAFNCFQNEDDNKIYTRVLIAYALVLLEHPLANASVQSLLELAARENNLLWWEDKTAPSLGISIEMNAYMILSLLKLGGEQNMINALKAVRWISMQRNAQGGFVSTQDTVLGLEAITKYAAMIGQHNPDLSVLVAAEGVDYVYKLRDDNRMTLTQIRLPVLPTRAEISAEGNGCVLVQSNLKYNVWHITGSDAFDISATARAVSYMNECSSQEITICARYKMADGESNMALLEVGMISGYVPDPASLNSLLSSSGRVKRFEQDQDTVAIYFDKLTSRKTCVAIQILREYIVDRLQPANVKLYDYYQPEFTVITSYEIPSLCSSGDPIDSITTENTLAGKNYNSFAIDIEKSPVYLSTNKLTIPDYIMEPIAVYVKPIVYDNATDETVTADGTPDFTPTVPIESYAVLPKQVNEQERPQGEVYSQMENTTINTETNIPSPTGEKQFCPICMDKLPSDIKNVYCSGSGVAKAAIRRFRKTKMLLDLHPSRKIQRLHASVEFILSPNCSCPPLDTPGSFALIINKDNDFLATGDHKQMLNDSFHIYGLPSVSGMPCKLAEARASCFNEENIACTQQDSLIYN